jgi:hypothetical protein
LEAAESRTSNPWKIHGIEMNWIALDEAKAIADFPTDLKPVYDAWLAANPGKAPRLAQIVSDAVAEFRDAILSNPANQFDADATKIPESCVRPAEVIIFNTLANEMGHTQSSADVQAMTRAELFLRQIGYGHFSAKGGDSPEPSPSYTTEIQHPERSLP